jgi:hypothetical protein
MITDALADCVLSCTGAPRTVVRNPAMKAIAPAIRIFDFLRFMLETTSQLRISYRKR